MHRTSKVLLLLLLAVGGFVIAADPPARPWQDPATAPAKLMPLADHALLLDLVGQANWKLAVGERGIILRSVGDGPWEQVEVPTRATLTAVTARGNLVWAVGHDGVIVHSDDGGLTWRLQRTDPWDADSEDVDPRQGAPLLDVLFLDDQRGFAIGSYALMLQTADGGRNWKRRDLDTELPESVLEHQHQRAAGDTSAFTADQLAIGLELDPHLNAMARTGSGALFIVAERGSVFRSRDEGQRWDRLQMPYDGSMFGVIGYAGDRILVFGLRGHAFESANLGDTWQVLDTGTELSLMGGIAHGEGGVVLVGTNGIVLQRSRAGESLQASISKTAGVLAGVLGIAENVTITVGDNGVNRYVLP